MKIILGIVLIVLLANTLSAVSSVVAVSDTFLLETDKMSYAHGEEVNITFTNGGNETVYFLSSIPFIISGPPGIVAPAVTLPIIVDVPPGESLGWTWDQFNEYLMPPSLVPPGNYTVTLEVYNSTVAPQLIANLSTSFWIAATSRPVGGIWIPADKLGLLAPYIALASTILVAKAATAIYVKHVKRRKKKQ